MMHIRDEKLDFWIKHSFNILFDGRHGVGKTSIIQQAFDRHKLKWRYFSAATLDPWVDFVGVPKEKFDETTKKSCLELIRPKGLDELEAIFFDEFNRSHKKVRNAVMELMQFKSINGIPLPNLRFIWAAINPDDEEYQVEPIDPAQIDRFHARVHIPYECDVEYFSKKYGKKVGLGAVEWWNGLPDPQKLMVSPRRLDYALDFHSKNGDLQEVLHESTGIAKLRASISHGPIVAKLQEFMTNSDHAAARNFLANSNNFTGSKDWIIAKRARMKFFVPLWSKEQIAATMASDESLARYVINETAKHQIYEKVVRDLYNAKQNKQLLGLIESRIRTDAGLAKRLKPPAKQMPKQVVQPIGGTSTSMFSKDFAVIASEIERSQNSQERESSFRLFDRFIKQHINECNLEETLTALDVLDEMADRSHAKTLENLGFIVTVNHCLNNISARTGYSINDMERLFLNKRYRSLLRKIRQNSHMENKLTRPQKATPTNPEHFPPGFYNPRPRTTLSKAS